MTTSQATAGTSTPSSLPNRVTPDLSAPARVMAETPRRSFPVERSLTPSGRQDEGGRSGESDATYGGARSRGQRHDNADDSLPSEEDGDYESSTHRRTPSAQPDEFSLTTVPLDTWVGRYVRITTIRHNGQTGLVHRTGNGWVNLQTAEGEVAKRAYDLLVIPEERANITPVALDEKGESTSRGKRYRGSKDLPSAENALVSGDDRKAPTRGRNAQLMARTTHSNSDSSGQDDDEEDEGDDHENGRSVRRRGHADDGGDFEDDDADDDGGDDGERYDDMQNTTRRKPFPANKQSRITARGGGGGGRVKERFGGGEAIRYSGKASGRRYIGLDRGRARAKGDQDKIRERDRGRGNGDHSRGVAGKDRDGIRGENAISSGKHKAGDPDAGGSRAKRKDGSSSVTPPGDLDDRAVSGGTSRERVDRTKDKSGPPGGNKKDEGMKNSWLTQIAKAKDRPNLLQWREELVPITKDSSEDFEDVTLSVELMKLRCDVCYYEKADGDKFCWNDRCWKSPIFFAYFKSGPFGVDDGREDLTPQHAGYINTLGRETVIDPALTSALQAPVKWLETKRKSQLETHEFFSEDPALYRWQCWASTFSYPNAKDPTHIQESELRASDKRMKSGHHRNVPSSKLSPEERSRASSRMHATGDGRNDLEHSSTAEFGRRNKQGVPHMESVGGGGPEPMGVADRMYRQSDGAPGAARRAWN